MTSLSYKVQLAGGSYSFDYGISYELTAEGVRLQLIKGIGERLGFIFHFDAKHEYMLEITKLVD